jgi:hypothetical protein
LYAEVANEFSTPETEKEKKTHANFPDVSQTESYGQTE